MTCVVVFLFISFAVVQCHQDVQRSVVKSSIIPCEGTGVDNAALINLMGDGKPIAFMLTTTYQCKIDMARKPVGDAKTGKLYDFQTSCYIVGHSDFKVSTKSKDEPLIPDTEDCKTKPEFQAVYLPQDVNSVTYMILKPAMAPWFFTSKLGGCDIFVATSALKPRNPIVIHSNLDSYSGDKLKNMEEKGKAVDKLLADKHPNYKLVSRVYKEPEDKKDKVKVNEYLEKYKVTHLGVALVTYNTGSPIQNFQFIGHYDGNWNFILKGEVSGKIIWRLAGL